MWSMSFNPCPVPRAPCRVGGPHSTFHIPHATIFWSSVVLWFYGATGPVWAAETRSSPVTSTTQLVVTLATDEILPVQSRFERTPPTIVVEFPAGRVAGTLPERSMVQRGAIEEIRTVYASATKPVETRWVQALKIQLRGPYTYKVRAQPGRIVIDLEHPAAITSGDLEVGLAGGTVISGTLPPAFNERFRAMQEALNRARPHPWVWRASSASGSNAAPIAEPPSLIGKPLPRSSTSQAFSSAASARASQPARTAQGPPSLPRGTEAFAGWIWLMSAIGLAGLAGTLWLWRQQVVDPAARRALIGQPALRVPSSIRVIDQLVWRAFERQGYQLLHMVELGEPLGLMRIMAKDGRKAALLCVGNGAFFEKTTVEQFLQSLRKAQAEYGFLVAPGSFTVPAQRYAKEHGVTLMGRDQLTQLLSDGAVSEYYTKQIQQLHKQLEDAQATLNEYAQQLDTIRRQRNEASWFLGEERSKTANLEAQVNEVSQQLRHWQAQAEQWQQAADATHKRWEESQWYLGEARASGQHADEQLRALRETFMQLEQRHQEMTAQLHAVERQRDESNWYLGEARSAHEALQQQTQGLADQLEAERSHRHALEAELTAMRASSDRRRASRLCPPDVTIEVWRSDGIPVFRGTPLNVSRSGFGFGGEQPLHEASGRLRVHLSRSGLEHPVEAASRLVWQRRDDGANGRSLNGCEFLDLSDEDRATLEQILRQT